MYIGELGSDVIFDIIVSKAKEQELMDKDYSTKPDDIYVCTSFVEDMLYIMSLNQNKYLPGGQLVKNSIGKLIDTVKPDAGQNPSVGTYVFYKLYGDEENGYAGIISFDVTGKATILHNGNDENKRQNVNIRTYNKDFNKWFGDDEKYPVIYKLITPGP
jgi:hypothetical protein